MSAASFYQWRDKYGGMDASMMKRLKELEAENARVKKMYAEEKLKSDIGRMRLRERGKTISTQGDGSESGARERP